MVDDGQAASAADSVSITVAARTDGFLDPLSDVILVREPATPPTPGRSFKVGRKLKLKLALSCGAQVLTDAQVTPPQIVSLTVEGSGASAGVANPLFAFSNGVWVNQLDTDGLIAGAVYRIVVRMPDGLRYAALILLR